MNRSFSGKTLKLTGRGFSGVAALLDRRRKGGAKEAMLLFARCGGVVLGERQGLWEFSIPYKTGQIVFRPQSRLLTMARGDRERIIAFDNDAALRVLNTRLRRDRGFCDCVLAFFLAAGRSMIRAESKNVRFPILDEVGRGKASRGKPKSLRQFVSDEDDEPGTGGWVGVDVPCFIACMRACEKNVEWWEFWMHAYCLVRCAFKCGTGGPAL